MKKLLAGAAAMKAVIAGDVMVGINNLSDAYRAAEDERVKILAVADLERNASCQTSLR